MLCEVCEIFCCDFFFLLFFGLEFLGGAKDLFGNMKNSEGGLRLNASAMDSLPQLVENPCIKKSNTRCVTIVLNFNPI